MSASPWQYIAGTPLRRAIEASFRRDSPNSVYGVHLREDMHDVSLIANSIISSSLEDVIQTYEMRYVLETG